MELIRFLLRSEKTYKKTRIDYKEELLKRQGREQFRRLAAKGLSLPIAFG